jgi:hypothetical protein
MLLHADPPLLPTPRQLAPTKDFEVLHSAHRDWVTQVQHIPGGQTVVCVDQNLTAGCRCWAAVGSPAAGSC